MNLSEANKLRILYFLVFSCTASWLPIFADFLKDQGLSGLRIGIVLSVTPIMMFAVQPFYGMLADRIGYRKCLIFSAILAACCYAFYLLPGGFAYYFLLTILMSLFYNTLQPVLDSLSLNLAEKNPSFSYGTLRIAGAAGWAFTGIIVGYYIDVLSTTVIFAFSAASMFLTFVFAFFLHDDSSDKHLGQNQSFRDVGRIFAQPTLIFILVSVFLISVGATTIWNFYSIYMKENGASASLVGFGLSFQGLCELPLFYFSAKIIFRLGLKATLLVTVFATALRLWLYSVVDKPEFAIPIELLHGISWSLFWVVCVECVNMLVQESWRATGQSLLYAAYFGLGQIVGNFWTGYLYDAKLKISDIFLLNAAIVGVVALCMAAYLRNKNLQRERAEVRQI
jgi:MFS transporter, PPP family, 3-phenylpropionic acid transporter